MMITLHVANQYRYLIIGYADVATVYMHRSTLKRKNRRNFMSRDRSPTCSCEHRSSLVEQSPPSYAQLLSDHRNRMRSDEYYREVHRENEDHRLYLEDHADEHNDHS